LIACGTSVARRWHGGNAQTAAAEIANLRRGIGQTLQADECAFDFAKERLALAGRNQPHAAALKELQARIALQLGDQPTHIRLRREERLGRGGHRPRHHHRAKRLDVLEIHPYSPLDDHP
jgi:hypothetical protein